VSNLAAGLTEEELRQFFGTCGTVNSITIEDGAAGKSAPVIFSSQDAADIAEQMGGIDLYGKPIVVVPFIDDVIAVVVLAIADL
jgi:RNA recognition motif-containing protein